VPFTGQEFKQPQTVLARWVFNAKQIFNIALQPPVYTEATLPDATSSDFKHTLIIVSDGTSGTNMLRYSDGATWVAVG